jgi:hypothetical protein
MSISPEQHRLSLAVAKAIAFYRRNPQATLAEVSAACEVSERTAWKARQQMVIEGVCKPNKRGGMSLAAPKPPATPAPPPANTIIDGEQLLALGAGDLTGLEDADPETRKKMLSELRTIAFTNGSADTRVTAMKAWFALKDMASAKDLGPGKPRTEEDAILRLSSIQTAVGIGISVKSLIKSFTLMAVLNFIENLFRKEPVHEAAQSDDATQTPPASSGAADDNGRPAGDA